ncbi:MAG: histidine kinase [Saprospiraceae bacterium]
MLAVFLTGVAGESLAQALPIQPETKHSNNPNTIFQQKADRLETALRKNDPYEIALAYEQLGQESLQNGDYAKAEAYFSKAKDGFEKTGKPEDLVRCLRGLAQSQEMQFKKREALSNYRQSSNTVLLPAPNMSQTLSMNDAKRIQFEANPDSQARFATDNLSLLKEEGNQEEMAKSYSQLADINLLQNDIPAAVKNYQSAIDVADNMGEAIKYAQQLSNVYSNTGQFSEAIAVQKKVLQRADIQENASGKIAVIQNLATIYAGNADSNSEAMRLFRESYELAIKENRTLDAKQSLEGMIDLYRKQGEIARCIELYSKFVVQLDSMLPEDRTLIDVKLMEATEAKIEQLELEKALKDQLIERKNWFNAFLIGASFLLLLLAILIARALWAIKQKNKKIALQSLRREMNPHFIFNSLNSVNQFIAQNNELAANKYLSSYSQLMRSMMEHSNKDFVSLSDELEMIRKYLDLEKQRFTDQFDFHIQLDETLDTDAVEIPNMVIQPHLENAIWHGLRYKETKGRLDLRIRRIGEKLQIEIEDNGIGMAQSKALKTRNQKAHTSRGMHNTQERIVLLNQLYRKQISTRIAEKVLPETGTLITIEHRLS